MQGFIHFLKSKIGGTTKNITEREIKEWIMKLERQTLIVKAAKSLVMAHPEDAKSAYMELLHAIGPNKEQKKSTRV